MKSNFVCFVELALKIDLGMSLGQFILCGNEVSLEVLNAKCHLELIVCGIRSGFVVYLERLNGESVFGAMMVYFASTYLTEISQVTVLIGLMKGGP